jgi:sialidase-1
MIVRVAAVVLILGILVFAALEAPFEFVVAPSTESNKRNSEADILPLRDGRLMLAWTEFFTGNGSDWGSAQISALFSSDSGRTWKNKTLLQENIGTMNVMEPDLLELQSGKIAFLFCRKNSEADCQPMARYSRDGGKTFTPPKPIPVNPMPAYTGMNNDRLIQLKSGRLVLPLWYTPDYRIDKHIRTRVYYSDDDGETWKQSKTLVDLPDSPSGAQEPGVVELKDGRLLLWVRTDKGKIYHCYSKDKGETWSKLEPMALDSPKSPQSIKRHPKTGDLILVWNNSKDQRFPLTAAVSKDEGKTWTNIRDLDGDASHTYAYTSMLFLADRALFTYYAGPPAGVKSEGRWSLKLKAVPLTWFYESPRP